MNLFAVRMRLVTTFLCCLALSFNIVIAQPSLTALEVTDSSITFRTQQGHVMAGFNRNNLVQALAYREQVRASYGSYAIKRKSTRTFTQTGPVEHYAYSNSHFFTGYLHNGKRSIPFEMAFFVNDTNARQLWLSVKVTDTLQEVASVSITYQTDDTTFYGGGEQFSHLHLNGQRLRVLTEENGIGRGDKPVSGLTRMLGVQGHSTSSYFPLPEFYTGSKTTTCITPTEVVMDFTKRGHITIEREACSGSKCLFNVQWDSATLPLAPYYQSLPDWAYGTVLGLQGGRRRVDSLLQITKAAGNPVTAIWIQDWVGRRKVPFGSRLWWTWEPDTTSYPHIKHWIDSLRADNIHVLGYINPFIIPESKWYQQAVDSGYLVINAKAQPYRLKAGGFDTYLADLANPAACEWFKRIIKTQLIDNGFSGWMADFAEWLPLDAQLHGGFSGRQFHNFYPVAWARINREAAFEAGLDDSLVIFHRSGNAGSQQYVKMLWTGDQTTDFGNNDGLPSALRAFLSSAMAGVPFNHADMGGYTNLNAAHIRINRNRELLYRWAEWAVFTPFFRTHEGLNPAKNIQVYSDSAAQHFFARMAQLHYALKDYLQYSSGTYKNPKAFITPLYAQAGFENYWHQYLLGEDLLVAPVIRAGTQTLEVKFPEGTWMPVWDANPQPIAGGETAIVCTPYGRPAVFVRVDGTWYKKLMEVFERFR